MNVTVDSGTQTISTPVTLASNSIFTVNSGALLVDIIDPVQCIDKDRQGMLTLTGSRTPAAATLRSMVERFKFRAGR